MAEQQSSSVKTTHWPEASVLKLFRSVTISSSIDKTIRADALKITEDELQELIFEVCEETFRKSEKFDGVVVNALGNTDFYNNHPLNLGIKFFLIKSRSPDANPTDVEIVYQFTRRAFTWSDRFPKDKNLKMTEGELRTGRFQPRRIADFKLPEAKQVQLEGIKQRAKSRCEILESEMTPNADEAKEYEIELLEKK